MQLNQPYDPRYNAKIYIPKLTEEQRRARATPLENLRRPRVQPVDAPAVSTPAELTVPTPLPTQYASADPPLAKGAIASDSICGESSEPRLPVIPTKVGIQKPGNVNAMKSPGSRMRENDCLPEKMGIPSRYHNPGIQPTALEGTVPAPTPAQDPPAPHYIPTAREVLFAEFPELFPFPYQEAKGEVRLQENSAFSEPCLVAGTDWETRYKSKIDVRCSAAFKHNLISSITDTVDGPEGTVLHARARDPQECFSSHRTPTPEPGTPQRAGPSPDLKNAGRSRTPGRLRRVGVHPSDSRPARCLRNLAFRTVPLQRSRTLPLPIPYH